MGELDEIRDAFRDWEFNRDNILKDIKILFPDLEFKYNIEQDYSSGIIPSFEISGEILLSKIRERKILDKDIDAKSREIELISINIESLFKELDRHIQDLNNLDKNWENVIYLEKDLNEVNIIISRLKGDILSLEKNKGKDYI